MARVVLGKEQFGQKPYLAKLHAEQVQLLSQFTSWVVTDPAGRAEIERVMGEVLK